MWINLFHVSHNISPNQMVTSFGLVTARAAKSYKQTTNKIRHMATTVQDSIRVSQCCMALSPVVE